MNTTRFAKYLPLVSLYYFHQQKDEYLDLIGEMDESKEEEYIKMYDKYKWKNVAGTLLSTVPGSLYFLYTGTFHLFY